MTTTKKLLVLTFGLILAMGFTACGSSEESAPPSSTRTPEQAANWSECIGEAQAILTKAVAQGSIRPIQTAGVTVKAEQFLVAAYETYQKHYYQNGDDRSASWNWAVGGLRNYCNLYA